MELKEFIKNIKEKSYVSCNYGKKIAVSHYSRISGITDSQAEAFYLAVKAALSNNNPLITIKASNNAIQKLLSSDYSCLKPFYEDNKLRRVESFLGYAGERPIYSSCKNIKSTNHGETVLILSDIHDKNAICFNGDFLKLTNPERSDYSTEVNSLIYSIDDMIDCKTSSILMGIDQKEASLGSETILEMIVAQKYDAGECPVVLFFDPKLEDIKEVCCSCPEEAESVRRIMSSCEFLIPVYSSKIPESLIPKIGTNPHIENDIIINRREMTIEYMRAGSKVASKPMAEQEILIGQVISSGADGIKVQWDNDSVGVYSLIDALMKIMPAPELEGVEFAEQYPPEVDRESCDVLLANGINPSLLYSMLSHFGPITGLENDWENKIFQGLNSFGIEPRIVSGYIPSNGHFRSVNWIEAELESGDRMIVDMNEERKIKVIAGEADDYILKDDFSNIELE